jgi:hypothetical protein
MVEVHPTQDRLGRITEVELQVGRTQLLLLAKIRGGVQPHELPCHVRLPRQMQMLLVELIPLEKIVLSHTTQVLAEVMTAEVPQSQAFVRMFQVRLPKQLQMFLTRLFPVE